MAIQSMKKRKKKKKTPLRQRITPVSVIAMLIGAMVFSAGAYGAATTGELNAYATAGLGLAWMGLVVGISLVRR